MLINCESHSKFAPLNPCTLDIFDRIRNDRGPLGQHARERHGYFTFPKLEGEISNRMTFRGKEVLVWSVNNYLGLANHPDILSLIHISEPTRPY